MSAQGACSRRIRVEHGIAHLKYWRARARHLVREYLSDTVQALASLPTISRPQPHLGQTEVIERHTKVLDVAHQPAQDP